MSIHSVDSSARSAENCRDDVLPGRRSGSGSSAPGLRAGVLLSSPRVLRRGDPPDRGRAGRGVAAGGRPGGHDRPHRRVRPHGVAGGFVGALRGGAVPGSEPIGLAAMDHHLHHRPLRTRRGDRLGRGGRTVGGGPLGLPGRTGRGRRHHGRQRAVRRPPGRPPTRRRTPGPRHRRRRCPQSDQHAGDPGPDQGKGQRPDRSTPGPGGNGPSSTRSTPGPSPTPTATGSATWPASGTGWPIWPGWGSTPCGSPPSIRSPMVDFGYDVSDYCDVDPLFGTLADFDALVTEAHALGLKVIIDWVPNHTSDRHPWFLDAASGRDSDHRNWYVWRDGQPGRLPAQQLGVRLRPVSPGLDVRPTVGAVVPPPVRVGPARPQLGRAGRGRQPCTTSCASGWTAASTGSAPT